MGLGAQRNGHEQSNPKARPDVVRRGGRVMVPARYRKSHQKLHEVRYRMRLARLWERFEAQPRCIRAMGFKAWLDLSRRIEAAADIYASRLVAVREVGE